MISYNTYIYIYVIIAWVLDVGTHRISFGDLGRQNRRTPVWLRWKKRSSCVRGPTMRWNGEGWTIQSVDGEQQKVNKGLKIRKIGLIYSRNDPKWWVPIIFPHVAKDSISLFDYLWCTHMFGMGWNQKPSKWVSYKISWIQMDTIIIHSKLQNIFYAS